MTHTTKHTPGPWVVRNFAVNGETRSEVLDANGGNACIQSNAHLIAAAPAMYEALVETMRVLRSLRDNKEEWYTLVTPELLTAWDKNKAALAQAEGRQA